MRFLALILAFALAPTPTIAQQQFDRDTVQVSGRGTVATPPDVAILNFWIAGEGRTADEASRALADQQKAISDGVRGLLGADTEVSNSELTLIEARDPRCGNDNRPRLSVGECAVIGFIARSQANVRTRNIAKAGTAVSLAGRLGARDARLQNFQLSDTRRQRQEALSRAMAEARAQGEALANASGRRLGRVLNVRDSYFGDYPASLSAVRGSAPPPPPPPPPVEIRVSPKPLETSAQVQVTFALEP